MDNSLYIPFSRLGSVVSAVDAENIVQTLFVNLKVSLQGVSFCFYTNLAFTIGHFVEKVLVLNDCIRTQCTHCFIQVECHLLICSSMPTFRKINEYVK